jgi:hypothetical protein
MLIDKQSFKASMDECNELFFQTPAAESLSFTDYEIITNDYTTGNVAATRVEGTVNTVSCTV